MKFIERYVGVNHRWNSPKFLYGESYGTTRSAALADVLENGGMSLNGVILMSTILNYFTHGAGQRHRVHRLSAVLRGHRLALRESSHKGKDLTAFLNEVRAFARGPYAEALAQGHNLPRRRRTRSRPSSRDTPGSASSSSKKRICE